MPAQVVQSFARQSGKTVAYIEKIWHELKDEYGEDYERIVGTLKKILKIDESSNLYLYINSNTLKEMIQDKNIFCYTDAIRLTSNSNLTEQLFPHPSLAMTDFNIRISFNKNKLEELYKLEECQLVENFAHYNLDDCITVLGENYKFNITNIIDEIFICPNGHEDISLFEELITKFENISIQKERKLPYSPITEEVEYNLYLEAKQVGVIYHFTDLEGISKLANTEHLEKYGCEIFTFISQNKHISTTRDFAFVDDSKKIFNPKKYYIRIALDGNKLSNKYKIKPINGLDDNDIEPFGIDKNNRRVSHKSEKEEVICPLYRRGERQPFYLKDYILDIQIFENKNAEDILLFIKENLKINNLNVPVTIVNKWSKVMNESTKGTYVSVKVKNHKELSEWFQEQGLETIPSEEMHCTIAYSRKEFQHKVKEDDIYIKPDDFIEIAPLGNDGCLVLKYKSEELQNRFNQCMKEGATYDYENYLPHTTIAIDIKDKDLINYLKVPNFPIILGDEQVEELDLEWKNKLTKEKEMSIKLKSLEEVLAERVNEGKNYILKDEKEVDRVLEELSYLGLSEDDYEKNISSFQGKKEYAVYSLSKKGEQAIEKVLKKLNIKIVTESINEEVKVTTQHVVSYFKQIQKIIGASAFDISDVDSKGLWYVTFQNPKLFDKDIILGFKNIEGKKVGAAKLIGYGFPDDKFYPVPSKLTSIKDIKQYAAVMKNTKGSPKTLAQLASTVSDEPVITLTKDGDSNNDYDDFERRVEALQSKLKKEKFKIALENTPQGDNIVVYVNKKQHIIEIDDPNETFWFNGYDTDNISEIIDMLKDAINESMNEETYKEFFAKKLEKYDVKSPSELSEEDKKKFYEEIDAEWKGDKEEVEESLKTKTNEEVDLSTKAIYELSKGNTAEFISLVKDAMFYEVGTNEKYPNKG